MKNYHLDKEEEQILKDFEKGEFVSVAKFEEEKKRFQKIAEYTLAKRKKKNINIRISQADLDQLRIKALEEGLPYQTLVASILHKYVARP